jgi:hypothetical protein
LSVAVASIDPNAKYGPGGYGSEGYIDANTSALAYEIEFENDASATAPAQQIVITDQLDADLDWKTLQFTEVAFGDTRISIPTGSQYFETTVSMTYNGTTFNVQIELGVNLETGLLYARFLSVDPATELPPNVLTGFLPPEDGTGRGQGHISYTVSLKSGLATGATITNVARIQFDGGEIIATNQVAPHDASQGTDPTLECLNTVDAGTPTSTVTSLPVSEASTSFTVTWSGNDDTGGSGVGTFDVYVSDNGGVYALWLDDTSETSATFTGVDRHRYRFYSVATDNVGHPEAVPTSAQAITLVDAAEPSLDVDGNGTPDALTDGILVLRYLFDPAGSWNYSDALGSGAFRTNRELIRNRLGFESSTVLDVDGNGAADALTDGILILRYLFDPTGSWNYSDSLGSGATRTTREAIRAYLDEWTSGQGSALAESSTDSVPDAAALVAKTGSLFETASAALPEATVTADFAPADAASATRSIAAEESEADSAAVVESAVPANPSLPVETPAPSTFQTTVIDAASLAPIVEAVLADGLAAGLSARTLAALTQMSIAIVDLPEAGISRVSGWTIYLDRDAAGQGWFVDSTPGSDEEFLASSDGTQQAVDPRAVDRVDLLTVMEYELDHLAGLVGVDSPSADQASGELSTDLRSGMRKRYLDSLFAEDESAGWL